VQSGEAMVERKTEAAAFRTGLKGRVDVWYSERKESSMKHDDQRGYRKKDSWTE
jgi:hypothetical protein